MPKVPFWIFVLLAILHLSAFYIDVMDVDASQYAEMSREMMSSGSYLQLYDRGNEYLDKPPFLLWVSSLSMSILGVSNFAYKLPSILFAFWAMYATYRFARLLYGEATGRVAALVLGTCQGMFLMTNDVRTDTILMSWVITALWLLKEWDNSKQLKYMVGGAAAIAFGMMTKGPIALFVPIFCFASDWALKREWKKFFQPAYLLAIVVIAILLIPMSIGLYQQFDMHPEKTVNGLQNVSGLRFFYWSQSFGRITGESPWANGAGFDFLLSSMLWAFLPWILLFLTGLLINIISLFRQGFRLQPGQEWLTTGGFILAYISLASSKYQLPHYIFVVFPLAATIVARLLQQFYEQGSYKKLFAVFAPLHIVISGLLLIAVLLILTLVFPSGILGLGLWAIAFVIWVAVLVKSPKAGKMFYLLVAGVMLANIFLSHYFYRNLLTYQLGSHIGREIAARKLSSSQIKFKVDDPLVAMHFYADQLMIDTFAWAKGQYVVTMPDSVKKITARGFDVDTVTKGVFFKVTEVTPDFLNADTRHKAVKPYYILQLK